MISAHCDHRIRQACKNARIWLDAATVVYPYSTMICLFRMNMDSVSGGLCKRAAVYTEAICHIGTNTGEGDHWGAGNVDRLG